MIRCTQCGGPVADWVEGKCHVMECETCDIVAIRTTTTLTTMPRGQYAIAQDVLRAERYRALDEAYYEQLGPDYPYRRRTR